MALVDDMAEVLERTRRFTVNVIEPVLLRYDALKKQDAEEAQLTEEDLENEPSDYTALSPEYGR